MYPTFLKNVWTPYNVAVEEKCREHPRVIFELRSSNQRLGLECDYADPLLVFAPHADDTTAESVFNLVLCLVFALNSLITAHVRLISLTCLSFLEERPAVNTT